MMTTGVHPLGSFNVPWPAAGCGAGCDPLNLVLPKESQGEKPVTATTAAEGAGKVQVYDELVEPSRRCGFPSVQAKGVAVPRELCARSAPRR